MQCAVKSQAERVAHSMALWPADDTAARLWQRFFLSVLRRGVTSQAFVAQRAYLIWALCIHFYMYLHASCQLLQSQAQQYIYDDTY